MQARAAARMPPAVTFSAPATAADPARPRSLGEPFAEAVFADARCGFAVSLPTAAEAPGAGDYSLGFVGWLLLGFEDEAAWEARRGRRPPCPAPSAAHPPPPAHVALRRSPAAAAASVVRGKGRGVGAFPGG
jgi:hypothetical protein